MSGAIEETAGNGVFTFGVDLYADDQDMLLCADVAFTGLLEIFVLEDSGPISEMDSDEIELFVNEWRERAITVGAAFRVSEDVIDLLGEEGIDA